MAVQVERLMTQIGEPGEERQGYGFYIDSSGDYGGKITPFSSAAERERFIAALARHVSDLGASITGPYHALWIAGLLCFLNLNSDLWEATRESLEMNEEWYAALDEDAREMLDENVTALLDDPTYLVFVLRRKGADNVT